MKSRFVRLFAIAGFGCAALFGCGSGGGTTGGSGGSGSGGKGSGGSASGGSTSTGGANGSGGNASGGATSTGGKSSTGGMTSTGGTTSTGGMTATGGAGTGSGGSASGGAGGKGSGGAGGGAAGAAGGSSATGGAGGNGTSAWACPTSVSGAPFSGTTIAVTRIPNAPPADTFNNMGNDFTNVEGPVWIGDSLYFSEYKTTDVPPSRILKIAPGDMVSELITDSGSNGLATDGKGNILSANHKAHGIVRFSLPDKTATTLVSMANSKALNSPNDLAVAADGTIYFTDPSHQNSSNPQGMTRAYQWKPGDAQATAITDYMQQPNGIALTLDGSALILGGMSGAKKYPITNGMVAMTGTSFGPSEVTQSGVNADGMTVDCAGNLYVAVAGGQTIFVVKPDGSKLGTVTLPSGGGQANVTNVAFGGTDHKTLYVTAQGAGKGQGVFKVQLNLPGLPY